MPEKKQYEPHEIDAFIEMARESPHLLPAFDDATGGAVSRKINGHGGAREGGGRPTLPKGQKASERVMINLTPSELDSVMACAHKGEKKGAVAKRLLLAMVAQQGEGED